MAPVSSSRTTGMTGSLPSKRASEIDRWPRSLLNSLKATMKLVPSIPMETTSTARATHGEPGAVCSESLCTPS